MTTMRWALALSSFLAVAPLLAQDTTATPPAKAADVQSQDAIMHAIYDVISGPGGSARDWNRFLSLFAPGARLIPSRPHGGDSAATLTVLTPQDYVKRVSARFEANGFFEKEISHTSETYGAITQDFSTYESRHAANDEKPFARGINSFQLFHDGKRWYIVTIYWAAETPATPIPEKYLKK